MPTRTLLIAEYGEKAEVAVRVHRSLYRPGTDPAAELTPHHHVEHQLVLVESGGFLMQIGDSVWTVPAGRVGWIPAGSRHDAIPIADSALTIVHVAAPPGMLGSRLRRPGVLVATDILRSLARFLARPDLDDATASHAATVLIDAVHSATRATPEIAVPRSPVVREVARSLLADPADERSLSDWAAACFVSERTLQRAFVADTGLGFRAWRSAVRLVAAQVMLEQGIAVNHVAARVGFSTTSGFVAAYRRHHGRPPGRHRHSVAPEEAARLVRMLDAVSSDLVGGAPLVD